MPYTGRNFLSKTLCLFALLLCGCSSITTEIQPVSGFRIEDYPTYTWGSAPLRKSSDANLLQLDADVRAAVDRELQRRGFQRVDNGASALIDYRIGSQMSVSQPGINSPRDEADKMWDLNRSSATDVAIYNHPTLPYVESSELWLTLKSTQTNTVVWQGKASKIIENANPGQRVEKKDIDKAVAKLIAQLTAKPK